METQLRTLLNGEYGLKNVSLHQLVGYDNLNFRVTTPDGQQFVLKLFSDLQAAAFIRSQAEVLEGLADLPQVPCVHRRQSGAAQGTVKVGGKRYIFQLLDWLEGQLLGDTTPDMALLRRLGAFLGALDQRLSKMQVPAYSSREIAWDMRLTLDGEALLPYVQRPEDRRVIGYFFQQFRDRVLPLDRQLRRGIVHNDANEWNVLFADGAITGLIDFGDMVHSWTISEMAVAIAYAAMHQDDVLATASALLAPYHKAYPLREVELSVLYDLVAARLCTSLVNSSRGIADEPDNEYLQVSAAPARKLLHRWLAIHPRKAEDCFRAACGYPPQPAADPADLLAARHAHLSQALSLSYSVPLHMEAAAMQWMYAADGRSYLDCVNNIMHVGHCHARVVRAGQLQLSQLNTNTRYLYPLLNEYADALCAKFPPSLNKVYFVNSGSAATDLALRLARAHTGREAVLVVDQGYHGNTATGISVSAYKFDGPGGGGAAPQIYTCPLPDAFRGPHRGADAGARYAAAAEAALAKAHADERPIAAFIAEAIIGCGGQILPPEGYFAAVYAAARATGAVCIADEVQTGFGRVGEAFWAFELHGVVPDIVVLGKPMGNGHPIGAVVTTEAIAASFENGMEFFSSFGGNPVSCAIGLEVLNVIEEEGLQENAASTGAWLRKGLQALALQHPKIGDVRGLGLFLGIEIVRPGTLEPDAAAAKQVVETMKAKGILLSTDGPDHNVIKLKPPLVFSQTDADFLLRSLREVLEG